MKKTLLALLVAGLAGISTVKAQVETYFSGSGEMIFSFVTIDNQGYDQGSVMRWAPFFNLQGMFNVDIAKPFGFFTGLAIRNVGYIYNMPDSISGKTVEYKKKFRTYNLGIPVGIKLGNLDKFFVFGGYEIEFPFQYKEKTFDNEEKTKFSTWFSKRVEPVQHSFFAGIQFPYGFDIKFKYYITNFHKRDFVAYDEDNNPYKPYDYEANVMYFSLSWNLFTNSRKAFDRETYKKEMR